MAEAYDQNVTPRFEPIAQEVVRLADPKPNELFLDVGTGTGLLACLIAPRVLPQGVVAIDLADGAISVGSYRAGNAGSGTSGSKCSTRGTSSTMASSTTGQSATSGFRRSDTTACSKRSTG